MAVESWELLSAAGKFVVLLAMVGSVGAMFAVRLSESLQLPVPTRIFSYGRGSASVGLVSTPLWLLIQVGAINQKGISGMFDLALLNILLQSTSGHSLGVRFAGFLLALAAVSRAGQVSRLMAQVIGLIAVLLLVSAPALTGHVATQPVFDKVVLALHVLGASLWIGALYPLLVQSSVLDRSAVTALMVRFGNIAIVIVGALLLAGIYLALQAVHTVSALWSTAYGFSLLLKLLAVAGLLALAALNKLVWVPRLEIGAVVAVLRISIRGEMVLASLVLAITAWLTTAVGPETM